MTSCLAAQGSASARREGKPDPLNAVREITPDTLTLLGVDKATLVNDAAAEFRQWIRNVLLANEDAFALKVVTEFLHSNLEGVKHWQVADLHLTAASLYWRQQRFLSSLIAAGKAVTIRPALAARPLKPLVRWFRPS